MYCVLRDVTHEIHESRECVDKAIGPSAIGQGITAVQYSVLTGKGKDPIHGHYFPEDPLQGGGCDGQGQGPYGHHFPEDPLQGGGCDGMEQPIPPPAIFTTYVFLQKWE